MHYNGGNNGDDNDGTTLSVFGAANHAAHTQRLMELRPRGGSSKTPLATPSGPSKLRDNVHQTAVYTLADKLIPNLSGPEDEIKAACAALSNFLLSKADTNETGRKDHAEKLADILIAHGFGKPKKSSMFALDPNEQKAILRDLLLEAPVLDTNMSIEALRSVNSFNRLFKAWSDKFTRSMQGKPSIEIG